MSAWGKREDAELVRLWETDMLPARDIGAALGRSKGAVLGRIMRLRDSGAYVPVNRPVGHNSPGYSETVWQLKARAR